MAKRYMYTVKLYNLMHAPACLVATACTHIREQLCSYQANMLRIRVIECSLYEYNTDNRNAVMNTIKVSHNRNFRSVPEIYPTTKLML